MVVALCTVTAVCLAQDRGIIIGWGSNDGFPDDYNNYKQATPPDGNDFTAFAVYKLPAIEDNDGYMPGVQTIFAKRGTSDCLARTSIPLNTIGGTTPLKTSCGKSRPKSSAMA